MNLYYGINQPEITTIFYYGEVSNIFNYVVYHLIKLNLQINLNYCFL